MTTAIHHAGSHALRERESVPERLVRIAARYAREGDVRRAQLASWAADVYVLEELLWENGLAEAPDPVAQLAAVGESVASALEALADGVSGEITPRSLVEAARRALVSTFDESIHDVLMEQMPSLDHLDDCAPGRSTPSASRHHRPGFERLGDHTAEDLVLELRQAAADCIHVREVLVVEGEETAADRMAHQADVATFEAYLIASAIHAGDHQLASVDLRWALARDLDAADWASVNRDGSPFATLRRELIALVGSAEMETLWRSFESAAGA
jgi:hypothetical protein